LGKWGASELALIAKKEADVIATVIATAAQFRCPVALIALYNGLVSRIRAGFAYSDRTNPLLYNRLTPPQWIASQN